MSKIRIKRVEKEQQIGPIWNLCGEDYGYDLFGGITPRKAALLLIKKVFTDEEISERIFCYYAYKYRGNNNLQDFILVYFQKL